jgi:hypothetical protein
MRNAYFVVVIALISLCSSCVYASIDYELRESRKCSSMFSYFERKHNLSANSLYAISLHETAKKHSQHNISVVWPWTVMNNKEGKGHHFKTQNEAIRYVRMQFAAGNNNLDVGCMQINLKHHPDAFSSLDQAFSPRNNIAYGAHFLSENRKKLGSMDKAIGRYHSATEHLAAKYRLRVSKLNQAMHEYNNNLQKVSYSSDRGYQQAVNPYDREERRDLFRKRNNRYVANKTKSYPKMRINVGRLQNDDWFRSKVYQR